MLQHDSIMGNDMHTYSTVYMYSTVQATGRPNNEKCPRASREYGPTWLLPSFIWWGPGLQELNVSAIQLSLPRSAIPA